MGHIVMDEFICTPPKIKLGHQLALRLAWCLAVSVCPIKYLSTKSSQYDSPDQFKVLTGKTTDSIAFSINIFQIQEIFISRCASYRAAKVPSRMHSHVPEPISLM